MPGFETRPPTWKLTLAYDGTEYSGWQVQPGRATLQQELAGAIARVTGEAVMPQGSGRTDAGVHALAQVASFAMAAPIPAVNFKSALNKTLPDAIRILSAEIVAPGFHARHSAVRKTYEYRVFTGEVCPPFLARYVAAVKWPLNLDAMREAARQIVGEHDFTSFAAVDPDLTQRDRLAEKQPASVVRTIFASDWRLGETQVPPLRAARSGRNDKIFGARSGRNDKIFGARFGRNDNISSGRDDIMIYRVTGSGFLHHMVRNLVGTFIDVGRGRLQPEAVAQILAARNRRAAGPTAAASGLFLHSVEYPPSAAQP
jgi:tRNA pseudouridine38-40 synthase